MTEPLAAPSYDELKVLYIISDKITPRYTLKDGLERIKRVMENNISEKIWDIDIEKITKYLISPADNEFEQISPDELEALRNRITETIINHFNSHTFEMACNFELSKCQYAEMCDPVFVESWEKIKNRYLRLDNYAHAAHCFKQINVFRIGLFRVGFGKMFVSVIEDIKNINLELLEIIKQAIEILTVYLPENPHLKTK